MRNPIDNFILARLEKEKLKFSPEASKETLIRRVSLDLIGLPPTLEEIDAFLADDRADAYERLVERLLASPIMESDGRGPGSISPVTPIPTDMRRTAAARCGNTAIG